MIYFVLYVLESPLHTFISSYVTLRSEYTVGEQQSKFYLFTVILISFFSYRILTKPEEVKLSISFLLFSLIMYMSESNIIRETAQPIFGVIGITFTAYFLFRLRLWLSLALFFSAFVFLSFGLLIDFIHERESIKEFLPNFIYYFLDMASEERFDVIGALLFALSAILSFQVPLRHLLVNNTKETLLILLSSGIMTVGNGLLHYQYNPDKELYLFAFMLTALGFLGIVFFGKIINKKYQSLTSISENIFYLLLFLSFVILPSYHTVLWMIVKYSLFIWLSIIIFMAIYMWRSHNTFTEPVHTV